MKYGVSTHYLPNFETRLDDMSDEEFEELIKKGEEEKAINREVWGEDNITLV